MGMLSRWVRPAGAIAGTPWRTLDDFLHMALGAIDPLHPELMNDSGESQLRIEVGDKCVEAVLPVVGCTPADFEVEVVGDYLTIRVQRHINNPIEEKELRFLRRERSFADFEASVKLPVKVRGAAAEAAYKDGVLCVKVPRETESEPKKMVVKVK